MTHPMLDIETLHLDVGAHNSIDKGVCVMELASYLAHEPFSDHPKCVSPVIGAFLRTWNDALDDDTRQLLKPYAARVLNTAGFPALEEKRAWLAVDWLARVHLPAWLDLAQLDEDAAALRSFVALTPQTVAASKPVLDKARANAAAARDAVRDVVCAGHLRSAAWSAAWSAARDSARDAALDAAGSARDAALDAAWAAAWAARAVARDAAEAVARAVARAVAWAAARDAAGAAAGAAWNAAGAAAGAAVASAGAAARQKLEPTVKALQESAFGLLDQMIETKP